MIERDIVILLGAGASYGVGHVGPAPPPLGKDLYDALAACYPKEWGTESHLGKWKDKFRHDFEKTMSDVVLSNTPSLSLLEWHRPVASFFAEYQLDGSGQDLYSRLISELIGKSLISRVSFGSLNYECLLEQAIEQNGLAINYWIDDVHPAQSISLAKIHGSCNFVTHDLYAMRPHLTMPGVYTDVGITVLPLADLKISLENRFSTYKPAIFPVLSMYTTSKPTFVAG